MILETRKGLAGSAESERIVLVVQIALMSDFPVHCWAVPYSDLHPDQDYCRDLHLDRDCRGHLGSHNQLDY